MANMSATRDAFFCSFVICALINIEGKEVAEEMIKAGMVWLYNAYCKIPECKHWKELETQAKNDKIGLWSNPTAQEPWLWRKEHRNN